MGLGVRIRPLPPKYCKDDEDMNQETFNQLVEELNDIGWSIDVIEVEAFLSFIADKYNLTDNVERTFY